MLVALKASPLPAAKTPPTRLLVAPWGRSESSKGPVIVNERTAQMLPGLQRSTGFGTVSLDFQHNTLPGTDAFAAEKEPRKIAASGKPLVVSGEGLYVDDLVWTPEGTDSFTHGHFPELSPAVKREDDGTVIFIHSAALVRQGAIYGLTAFSASVDPVDLFRTMDPKLLLLSILGLAATATEAEITTAAEAAKTNLAAFGGLKTQVEAFAATITSLTDKVKALETGLAAAGKDTAAATVTALSADLTALKGTVEAINTRAENAERAVLVRDAMQAGKIVPLSAQSLSIPQMKTLLDELPADQVPLERRTPEGVKAFSAGITKTDTAQEAVNRVLGIKPEVYAKHNAAA